MAFAIELQECEVDGVARSARAFAENDIPSTDALMSGVSKPNVAKFNHFLSWDLMTFATVRERLEIDQLPRVAGGLKRVAFILPHSLLL